jgi:hypothetical protein
VYKSPFDLRGDYTKREPPKIGQTIESPEGRVDKEPYNVVESNFHRLDPGLKIHKAYHQACNLNKIHVYEGEGMPGEEKIEPPEKPDKTGHALTFLELTDDTRKIIKRSVLRLAECPENQIWMDQNNLRLDKAAGKTLQRKVNFRTVGIDPSLADNFTTKTLSPDTDAMNDASSPIDDQDDNESIDTEAIEPASIKEVPELPEKWDEELDNPVPNEDTVKTQENTRGWSRKPRKVIERAIGTHRSKRIRVQAKILRILDPAKAKLHGKIEEKRRSWSPKEKERIIVEASENRINANLPCTGLLGHTANTPPRYEVKLQLGAAA